MRKLKPITWQYMTLYNKKKKKKKTDPQNSSKTQ